MLNRKLLPLLFASFIFSGELEVDGNLNVSGTIESQTIDSLLQVIAELQAQIVLLQQEADNKLETRVFNINNNSFDTCNAISLQELTGYDLEFGLVKLIKIEPLQGIGEIRFQIDGTSYGNYSERGYINADTGLWRTDGNYFGVGAENSFCYIRANYQESPMNGNILIAITAQFPD